MCSIYRDSQLIICVCLTMFYFIWKCVFLLALIFTLDQAFCAVNREFQELRENDVDEFSMSSDEETAAEDNDVQTTDSSFHRRVVANLTVRNGGPWGDWGPVQFCAGHSYAVGYNMKIERKKRMTDNTALNAIKLVCEAPCGKVTGDITSTVGHWGSWIGQTKCQPHGRKRLFLTSFDLQVEGPKRGIFKDNTAANYVKFQCRDYRGMLNQTKLVKIPGNGFWGTWGAWSEECPDYSAICGIQTKVEKPRGVWHDDTALNDVKFYCCR